MGDLVSKAGWKTGVHTPGPKVGAAIKPTQETYDGLIHAYDHFNWTLFETTLPNCLITLQRKGRSYGYFHHERFKREDGAACDEIALNPAHFQARSTEEVLSTLVHEMVHLWQFHHGTPGRGRYHNRQWAEKMRAVGLYPSDTGQPGGKELGDQVSHYINDDGAFRKSANELLSKGFKIEWQDNPPPAPAPLLTGSNPDGDNGGDANKAPAPKAGKRVKYTCPVCGLNAWSKHEASLLCGEDRAAMLPG